VWINEFVVLHMCGFICVVVCMCELCNVWFCVSIGFVRCGCA
jgi:hypothetical protein